MSLLRAIQTKKFVVFLIFFARLYDYTDVMKGLQQQKTNVERAITLVESIMDQTEAFDTGKVINYALWHYPGSMKLRISILSHLVERPSCEPKCKKILLLVTIFGISVKESEIEIFKNYMHRRLSAEEDSVRSYSLCVTRTFSVSPHYVLQLVLLTIPQTSATVERLFSSVKRIKTSLRSLMTTESLSSLCLIPFEKDLVRTIDREHILTHFKNSTYRRLL